MSGPLTRWFDADVRDSYYLGIPPWRRWVYDPKYMDARGKFHLKTSVATGIFSLCVLSFIAVTIAVGLSFARVDCRRTAAHMDVPWQWGTVEGCFVRVNGRWVPADSFRKVEQ